MKRIFWVGVGVVATVVVLQQIGKVNEKINVVTTTLTPTGMATSIGGLAESVRNLGRQVREGMAQNEQALRGALLPSDAELAAAREVRAAHKRRSAHDERPDLEESAVLPDDGTDYF